MKYLWKYYKSKTPKNSTGFYFTDEDDECLGEVILTETAAREVNDFLNKQSDTYIYRRLFTINENVIRNNMRNYDRMLDEMHTARKEEEKKTGRRMTIKERIDFCNNFEKNYYHNKEAD